MISRVVRRTPSLARARPSAGAVFLMGRFLAAARLTYQRVQELTDTAYARPQREQLLDPPAAGLSHLL
jgi:hypothetical protein